MLKDYQIQLMFLEQRNKSPPQKAEAEVVKATVSTQTQLKQTKSDNDAGSDYHIQLMLLQQQNRKRS
jgi:hypothetical protein